MDQFSRAKPVNAAYERGWTEGWEACLARVLEDGLESVMEREGYVTPSPLSIVFASTSAGD